MKRKLVLNVGLGVALAIAALGAQAVNQKSDSPYDFRIKSVIYNPLDVVQVDGVVGLATHIQLAPDEFYVTHVFGGEDMWELSNKDNNIFIRPIDEFSDTNLTLVTNKRTYYLVLHYIGGVLTKDASGQETKKFIETPWSVKQATLGLIYKYPFEDMQAANKELEQRRIREALAAPDKSPKNINYKMSDDTGTADIKPVNVWDNYRFTSFKFPENADLPAISFIAADGKEQVVNTHPDGASHNIIVAEMTAREWRIRSGDKVIGVINGAYNPSLGANPNGTTTPAVKRVLLKGETQ